MYVYVRGLAFSSVWSGVKTKAITQAEMDQEIAWSLPLLRPKQNKTIISF